jgi:hypothetical protein
MRSSQVYADQQAALRYTHAYEKDINDAFNALNNIKKGDLTELKSLANPPANVKVICDLVCILRGVDPSWNEFKKQIANPKGFIDQLHELDYN